MLCTFTSKDSSAVTSDGILVLPEMTHHLIWTHMLHRVMFGRIAGNATNYLHKRRSYSCERNIAFDVNVTQKNVRFRSYGEEG